MKSPFSVLTAVFLFVLAMGTANAMPLDLTMAGNSGTINGALFVQVDPQSTGTGVIDSFVQIGSNATVNQAYNTTVNNVLNNGSSNNFNHSITLSQVPTLTINSVDYYEFLLDVNENSSAAGGQFISLDEVQIFVGGTANASFNTFDGTGRLQHDGTLVYRMDGAGNDPTTWVALDFQLNSGSGSGDMFMYVPVSNFGGAGGDQVVTLFSRFGDQGVFNGPTPPPAGNYGTSDGFEEWAVRVVEGPPPPAVPEPGATLLLGLGLVALALLSSKQRMGNVWRKVSGRS